MPCQVTDVKSQVRRWSNGGSVNSTKSSEVKPGRLSWAKRTATVQLCRRRVDFPPMFGPVRRRRGAAEAPTATSFGMKVAPLTRVKVRGTLSQPNHVDVMRMSIQIVSRPSLTTREERAYGCNRTRGCQTPSSSRTGPPPTMNSGRQTGPVASRAETARERRTSRVARWVTAWSREEECDSRRPR